MNLAGVLDERCGIAPRTGQLEDRVALGALLADLGEFDEADLTYCQALRDYQDVSPIGVAWVCFQLGVLWAEVVAAPQPAHAAQWYARAIA